MKVLGAALLAAVTLSAAAADEIFGGLPAGAAVQVLPNPGFVVGYSAAHRQALWVGYRAESMKGRRIGKRPANFEPDPRVAKAVNAWDYKGSGYTRGHLAPNYLIGRLYGRAAQHATFLMSNVSPQRRRLNELVWQRLEEAEADVVAPHAVQLWVMTGPLFDPQPRALRAGIAVPTAFYRIWLDLEQGRPQALAFIVPQDVCGTEPLSRYVASVDDVERRAGLDFFRELADPQEHALERAVAAKPWRIERFDRKAPRYAGNFDALDCPPE